MAFTIPKLKGAARSAFDPLGVDPLGTTSMIFGDQKGPDYSAQEAAKAKALADNKAATEAFVAGGPAKYANGANLVNNNQGDTQFDNITTDPRYKEAQLAALQDLEDQGKNGFNASDRADMARNRAAVDAANRGRVGAINQRFQSSGQGGGGLNLVSQLQSAQDASQIEAMRALETEANAESRKTQATAAAGGLATNLQGNEFNQAAAKAQAQDRINQFNTQNSNTTNTNNWNRTNQTSDRNSGAQYDFNKDVLGAKQNQGQQDYNVATDQENGRRIDDAAAEKRAAGATGAALGIAGGVVGGIYGGPAGASAGAQVGSGVGQQVGTTQYRNNYWKGGKVPDDSHVPGDSPLNDTHNINVAGGEIIVPRTQAKSPAKAAKFAARAAAKPDHEDDLIGSLLAVASKLHGRGK